MAEQIKKTPKQWLAEPRFQKYVICDPDGWDRKNFEEDWQKPLTVTEFSNKLLVSSVIILPMKV